MRNLQRGCICILALLIISGFTRREIAIPGLTSPVAIGQFLNGNLPSTTPSPIGGGVAAPNLLSQTGAFANLITLDPSPGVIPYDMIEPFWSDGAAKSRWMAIPNDGTHNTAAEQIQFSNEDPWIFPTGSVLIKHFELGGQRLETRFEVKGTDGVYYYLTYKWNEDETDAQLLYGGLDEEIMVNGTPQTWRYPSVAECLDCHTLQAGSVLEPKTRHLNSDLLYPSTGQVGNQLVTLSHLGILDENITDENVGNYLAVAAKDDLTASLEYRARSYIDVNCSNCHQPGATNGGQFDARITTPLADQGIIYGPLIYDEGLIDPKVVIPQDVPHSMMHFRMNSLVNGIAMPPLAKDVVDADGVQLIADWINSLTPATSSPPVALFSASPTTGTAPLLVNFDASSSTDADGDPLTYSWQFGDGASGSGLTTSHTYSSVGTYDAILTVDDGQFTDFTCVTITVTNQPANPLAVSFTDNTSLLGTSNFSGVAVAISDMNADGRDDIIRFNQARNLNIQYQQSPDASFAGYSYGSVSGSNQWSVCIADFDHNGFNDILSGGAYDNIKLISNNNGFNSYSQQTLANSNIFIQGSNFVDINNDGWADIFACHDDAESRAYENNQNGTFTFDANLISTETTPNSDNSGNYASMWTDYDNDGDLDLYISKCRIGVSSSSDPRRINMLWQNDGNNNFSEVSQAANLKIGEQSWVSDFGDIDNDGDLDAIVINHYANSNLMLNNGDGTFTDVTAGSGLFPALQSGNSFGIQCLFRDFNNDGFVDLIFTGAEHYMFYNNGDGSFTQAPNPFNSNDIESLAVGDLNHDGFLDVYAAYANIYNSPSSISDRLFMNDGNSNNFIGLQLQGVVSNINGIGARVELYGSWGKQIREVRSGEGYGIHNSFTQHFGIGSATTIDKIIVRWPSGIVQEISNPGINQFLGIVEQSCSLTGPCDDGDPCTINDAYNASCNCEGTLVDQDMDGVCAANDPDDNDPCNPIPCPSCTDVTVTITLDNYPQETSWQIVDDGGTVMASGGTYGSLPDGTTVTETVCLEDGCYDFTINDTYGDGICCGYGQGDYSVTDSDGNTLASGGQFTFSETTNFCLESCQTGQACDDGNACTTGDAYDANCNCVGTFQDSDGDGVCDADDVCAGFDDALIGTACDDGNDCTINDTYDGSCDCKGLFQDSDDDGVCDADDVCPGFDDALIGTACDDGDDCTDGDIYDGSCNCAGVLQDADGDGVCDADDICAGFDDNLIGTACDDGDACTTGDTYDGSCNCVGTYQDSDGDGVCDADDVCAGFDDALIGTACDDGDDCTDGDIYDGSCNCAGVLQDADGDGVCDADDVCAGFDDNLIGTACNDGDDCTTSDTYDGSCNCVGTYQDSDGDGVCDADDVCAGFDDTLIGTSCNDGDDCTINDVYDGSCNCAGVLQDADGDGVCDADDICAGFDDNLIGTACDDGDACTTGDTYDGSCNCVGTYQDSDGDGVCDADDVCAGFDDALIGTACDDGDDCTTGDTYDGSCNCGGTFQDADGDGVCDADDVCAGFDDNLIGTACNDGDACTTGDAYDGSCNCVGTYQDSDGDGVCDADDVCAGFDDALIGTACDDGDACTTGDTYDGSCNCVGTFQDADDDGVCDADDVCAGFDDNLIGTACNDGDACTTGDTYDGSCNCVGTFQDADDDGVCDADDVCAGFDDNLIGTACNDGDACTTGDTYDGSCNCVGTYQDSDGDGVCDAEDVCAGFDDNLIGTACDDGDACTTGDTYDGSCNCVGTYVDNDGDGVCAPQDPNDNDPCIPISCQTCTEVTLTILLDNYPEETSWIIEDQNGDVVASGGTYGSSPDGSTITVTECLDDGCYDFTLFDSYGDGICCGYGIGNYSLVDEDGNTLASGGQFGSSETTNFCLGVACPIGNPCDDGDPCTTGETYDSNCNCTGGTLTDNNNNGVCDAEEGCVDTQVDFENFGSGWGIWNDGGSDCRRSSRDQQYAYSGTYCFRLRDNTSSSVATTDLLDLSSFEEITVDFTYLPISMENNEDFWLQVSTNGGSSYTIVADYDSGDEFTNGNREFESVTIQGPFSANTRLRFRCDASGNGDRVYFDDVRISGCTVGGQFRNESEIVTPLSDQLSNQSYLKPFVESTQSELMIFPNPADTEVFISRENAELITGEVEVHILHITGQQERLFSSNLTDTGKIQLNVERLQSGVYYIMVRIDGEQQVLRFIKQ